MVLKDLFQKRMKRCQYRSVDIARILGISRQAVSITLHRDIDKSTVETIRKYAKAIGVRFDIKRAVSN